MCGGSQQKFISHSRKSKIDVSDWQTALFSRGNPGTRDLSSCASVIFNLSQVSMYICLRAVEGAQRKEDTAWGFYRPVLKWKNHPCLYPSARNLVIRPNLNTGQAGKCSLAVGPERRGNGFIESTVWVQSQADLGSNSSSANTSHVSLHASISLPFKG